MNTMVVVAMLVILYNVGYLQPACNAGCTVILIFHTVKTCIYYAEKKILLSKLYLLAIYAICYCEHFVLFTTASYIGHFR